MTEETHQAETERLGKLYVASRRVSRVAAISRSRDELLKEIVRVLVDAGNFVMDIQESRQRRNCECQPNLQRSNESLRVSR